LGCFLPGRYLRDREGTRLQRAPVSDLLRQAILVLLTFTLFAASASLASVSATGLVTSPDAATRGEPVARAISVSRGASEATRASLSGQSLVLARGVSVTVVDGGAQLLLRAPLGSSVTDTLDLAGVRLGPLDQVVAAGGRAVASGDLIRVLRVVESQTVVREAIPFTVTTVADPSLIANKTFVAREGVNGLADNGYRIKVVDGAEAERTLLSSLVLREPVDEVRHIGTRIPPGPSEIETVIRAAAATWGADVDQLLRIAWCESRYNPAAYNASSGASGLFQFIPGTWVLNSPRSGFGGASVFDPVANANTAAMMFASGQARQWACK
jgi:surface rod structure-forming protein G/transglycosylase-like protein with SLT domain